MFFLMRELSLLLRKRRHHRGSIDFDFPESRIILNGAGRAIDVQPCEANAATEIIEDFMLLANETVAKEYCKGDYPFIYRTHENPDPEKVENLLSLIRNRGIGSTRPARRSLPERFRKFWKRSGDFPMKG